MGDIPVPEKGISMKTNFPAQHDTPMSNGVTKCVACGEDMLIPLVGKKKPRPSSRVPLCDRVSCIAERAARKSKAKKCVEPAPEPRPHVAPICSSVEGVLPPPQPSTVPEKREQPDTKPSLPPTQPKNPYRLRSVPQPVVPNPASETAPFGYDENDNPIGVVQPKSSTPSVTIPDNRPLAPVPIGGRHAVSYADILAHQFDRSRESGKPIAVDWLVACMSGRTLGMPKQEPNLEPAKKSELKFDSYREFLRLTRKDIISLFDKVACDDDSLVETKTLLDKAPVEARIVELQTAIAELTERAGTRTVRWQKIHRKDDPLSRKDLNRLLSGDKRELEKKRKELRELRARLKDWGADDRDYEVTVTWQKVPVLLKDVFNGSMRVELAEEFKYIADKEKKVGGIVTHTTTLPVYEITSSPELYTLADYKAGVARPEWVKWENQVIIAALRFGIVIPRAEAIRRHAWLKRWENAAAENDGEHDAGELVLIRKTGGGEINGSIYARGSGRKLEDFDATMAAGTRYAGPGEDFGGEDYVPDVSDDSESFQPD
jgi:hypothetical protein